MTQAAFESMRVSAGRFGDGLSLAFGVPDEVEARAAMAVLALTLLRMGGAKDR